MDVDVDLLLTARDVTTLQYVCNVTAAKRLLQFQHAEQVRSKTSAPYVIVRMHEISNVASVQQHCHQRICKYHSAVVQLDGAAVTRQHP